MSHIPKINLEVLEKDMKKYYRFPIILDTGPLIFLLMGLCSKGNEKNIWQGRTKKEFELLIGIIRKFKGIVITPQVLAECTNLLNQNGSSERYKYLLERMIDPLKKCQERYIEKDIILSCPKFPNFGSTDISLIECSKKHGGMILTDDGPFKWYCEGNKIPALNFNKLKPSIWE